MQYKIPVQIENEDRIILGLSLRQLMIILAGGALAYGIFQKIVVSSGQAPTQEAKFVGGLLAFIIVAIAIGIAKFNQAEMTFLPFILNYLRLRVNGAERVWGQGIDSVPHLQIGYVSSPNQKEFLPSQSKAQHEIYDNIQEKLKNL